MFKISFNTLKYLSKDAEGAEGPIVPEDARPKAAQKKALYALGFAEARSMFGHILDMQAREDDIALVREQHHNVGSLLLETWLDDVLMARPVDGRNPMLELGKLAPARKQGLAAYGIDREALTGAGVSEPAIERVYRGLYVYSVGFSDMLRVRYPCALLCSCASAMQWMAQT